MAILLLFYKLVLERENMHTFKRFFLLGAIVVSFIIPAIVFVDYVEPTVQSNLQIPAATELSGNGPESVSITKPTDMDVVNWPMLFWTIYCLGLIGFGFRFFRHLFQIFNRIKANPKFREHFSIKVLLEEKLPPHTFFSYIFLNKNKFESNSIPQAVLTHEETHAKEYHSLDVLFIEFLQVIFWFNPLIYFFKKSIKLNHEFLADSAVLKKETNTSDYQNTLLSYLSKESLEKYQSTGIANAINYSSTRLTVFGRKITFGSTVGQVKKRFTIMKKRTSKKSIAMRSILLLPLTLFLLFAFSTSKEMYIPKDTSEHIEEHSARSLSIEILQNGNYVLEGIKVNKDNLVDVLNQFNTDINPEIRNKILNIHLSSSQDIPNSEVWFIYNSLWEYGFYRIVTPNQEIIREKGNTPFAVENGYPGKEEIEKYNALATKHNAVPIEKRIIPMEDLRVLESIYQEMTDEQKQNAQPFPECLPQNQKTVELIEININNKGQLLVQDALVPLEDLKSFLSKINDHLSFEQRKKLIRSIINVDTKTPKDVIQKVDKILTEYGTSTINIVGPENSTQSRQQQSATRDEMAAYNALAKKYNEMDRNQMYIKQKEVTRLKEIYGKMSDKQKADAEPFPNFPPPPPAPDAPELNEIKDVPPPKPPKNVSDVEYAANQIENIVEEQDPYDVVGGGIKVNQPPLVEQPLAPTYVRDIEPTSPPPPPEPQSPLDHIIDMAKKGATFIYKGKEISSDKAIDLIKNSSELSISTKQTNDGTPVVKISKYL